MKRVLKLLSLALGAMLLASIMWVSPAGAATVHHVGPGESIQAADAAAQPGDTIVVAPGVYYENVEITTDDITLKGAGAFGSDNTVLLPPANPPKGELGGIGIAAHGRKGHTLHGVHVNGFLVKGFKDFGIGMFQVVGPVIARNKAVDNGEYGISGFVLRDGKFVDNVAIGSGEAGYYVGDSPHADFVLRRNVAHDNDLGFLIRDASHGTINGNRATHNCAGFVFLNTGAPGGARDWTLSKNRSLRNNHVCKSDEGPPDSGTGVAVVGAREIRVRDNRILRNRPSAQTPFAGGIVVVSSKMFGGTDPIDITVGHNQAHKNRPADLKWDGSGRNVRFVDNSCGRSDPPGSC